MQISKGSTASPRDCALVIAIPLDKAGFLADLDPACEKDFAKSYCRGMNLSLEGLWSLYEPFAGLALDVAAEARRRGVTVVLNGTLADFAACLSSSRVITLVAHWRSAWLRENDLSDLARLTEEEHKSLERITGFSWEGLTVKQAVDNFNAFLITGLPQAIVEALRRDGEGRTSDGGPADHPLGLLTRGLYAIESKRQEIKRRFPAVFKGGSAIEFADRFYLVKEIVDAISAAFSGVLDLTICNSILLGEAIRRKCLDSVVMLNEEKAFLDFRFALYRQIIRSLDRKPQSFLDAAVGLREGL